MLPISHYLYEFSLFVMTALSLFHTYGTQGKVGEFAHILSKNLTLACIFSTMLYQSIRLLPTQQATLIKNQSTSNR